MRPLLHSLLALALLQSGASPAAAGPQGSAAPPAVSPRVLARDLLRELIAINTSPAQGCTRATQALAARLRSAGFPDSDIQVDGPRPERQNLVVHLRGSGQARPILLIAHLDVVDASPEGWLPGLDPFQLAERDGFLYGRGVLDVKGAAAGLVANLIDHHHNGQSGFFNFRWSIDFFYCTLYNQTGGNKNQ